MGRYHRPMHTDSAEGISGRIHHAIWVGSCSESLIAIGFGTGFFWQVDEVARSATLK
jgi:hypothetical protein